MAIKHTATFDETEIAEAIAYYLQNKMRLRVVGKAQFSIQRGYSDPRESTPDRVSVSFDVSADGTP